MIDCNVSLIYNYKYMDSCLELGTAQLSRVYKWKDHAISQVEKTNKQITH